MKRLALVSVIVLVSLVGTVGICLAADQACESLLTQMAVIQQKLDALQASIARIQSRQYFLTTAFLKGNQANDTVCGPGFHFASIYEILDPTTMRYASDNEYALKEPLADMGRGPPQRLYGWIRTGQYADRLNIPGSANCDAWQVRRSTVSAPSPHSDKLNHRRAQLTTTSQSSSFIPPQRPGGTL